MRGVEYEKLVGSIAKTMHRYPRNCQMRVMTTLKAYIQSGLIDVCNSEKVLLFLQVVIYNVVDSFNNTKKYLNDDEMVMLSRVT